MLGYVEWLKRGAEQGNVPAIIALRKRGAVAPALINITTRDLQNVKLIAAKITHVTGRGTLFYKAGNDVFRDSGGHLSLKKEVSDAGVKAALLIAMVKYGGKPLTINGPEAFKERCIAVAVREGMAISFSNPTMEQKRMDCLQHATVKEDRQSSKFLTRSDTYKSSRVIPQKTSGMTR